MVLSQDYIPRIADVFVEQSLRRTGALLIEGPKGCGKTATARHHAESEIKVDIDPDVEISMGGRSGSCITRADAESFGRMAGTTKIMGRSTPRN